MRVTVDYTQVYRAQSVLRVLLSPAFSVEAKARPVLRRFVRHIDAAIKDIEPDRMEMLKETALLDENGEPKLGPPNEQGSQEILFENGGKELFVAEFEKLQRAVTVSIEPIYAHVFEQIEGQDVMGLMLALGDLVYDAEEYAGKPERVGETVK